MDSEIFEIWGHQIPSNLLSIQDKEYLGQYKLSGPPPIKELWAEMDRIWDTLELNNRKSLENQNIAEFYSHPVWILNGLFSASDVISSEHRELIARFVLTKGAKKIADYGGGFGQLAIRMAEVNDTSSIEIIEPFPSAVGHHRISSYPNINIFSKLGEGYDIIIAQDVLEHVEDPILLAMELILHVKMGGYLIFANCFYDFIKCHLPCTFHLRHTFPWVMKMAGLKYVGVVPGVMHAQVFKKSSAMRTDAVRRREEISRFCGPIINVLNILK